MFSEKNNYFIVNYHYVRDPDPAWAGINPCPVAEFERQIGRFASRGFKMVSVPEVYRAAQQKAAGKFCAITFDDGLKDNYENALPILKKHGATATFLVLGAALEGRLPMTQALHALLSKFSANELIDAFNQWAPADKQIPKDHPLDDRGRRRKGDLLTNNFKEGMIRLPEAERKKFVDLQLGQAGLTEAELNRIFFMNKEELTALDRAGMHIGSHSYRHESFELLDLPAARESLRRSKEALAFLGKDINVFSYPHGRYNAAALEALAQEGFHFAMTIEPRPIAAGDAPLVIPRFDANDFVGLVDG